MNAPARPPVLLVREPGVFTTVQDLGRPGRRASGVPPGGAVDRFALAAANLLVGNPEGAAALECALSGPSLLALRTCLVAVTGADFRAALNGDPMPTWTALFLAEGDLVTFAGRRWGARVYIAVAGGLEAERWLGSASRCLWVGRVLFCCFLLRAVRLFVPPPPPPRPAVAHRSLPPPLRPAYGAEPALGAVPGPHLRLLAPAARRTFFRERWTVSRDADRMGYRLEGTELPIKAEELVSFGLAMGCVQVPRSGQPILLMADYQTAGGYPVVAGVGRSDLPLAAQLVPGEHLWFHEVTVETAQGEWRRRREALDTLKQ